MKVLIVGSGGREHTLAWKIAGSALVSSVLAAPGNVGIAAEPKCRVVGVSSDDTQGLLKLALNEKVDLVIVGPEAPLVEGLADVFRSSGLRVFGPSGKAALLEGSKVFAKELLQEHGIPTPDCAVFHDFDAARRYVQGLRGPVVVKADGLAAGKGVFVCRDQSEALYALTTIMKDRAFGAAGDRVVVEDCLEGEEASFIAITDGSTVLPLASSQDHKAIFDGDQGPNTGGMGAYSPAPVVTSELHEKIMSDIMIPVVKALDTKGASYLGFLYAGLMIKDGKAQVLEFNVRMGDPEAQPLLYRMESDLVPIMMATLDGSLSRKSIDWSPEDAVCVVMSSQGYPGAYEKGKRIDGLEQAAAVDGVKVFHAGTSLGPEGFVTSGGRVLGVTAKAMGIDAAVKRAYEAAEKIRWDGVHYRKDIGRRAIDRS